MSSKTLKLKGSKSCYDVECGLIDDPWERMWVDLRLEYWQELFDNCGNIHPFRSAFGKRLSFEKRQVQCLELLEKQTTNSK